MGHSIGDQVLKSLATILKKQIDERGSIVRWGGEEFLIILPNSNKAYAKKISEKIRRSIEQTTLLETINVTVSIGIEDNENYKNVEEVIVRADQAMYKAKKTGRNRTCELTA